MINSYKHRKEKKMRFVFIGRYEKSIFVDIIIIDEKEKAIEFYQKELLENPNGYNHIELLEQTATHYFTKIEENVI